jgi:CII-binding regulator of phage lambda lysogenization HflD
MHLDTFGSGALEQKLCLLAVKSLLSGYVSGVFDSLLEFLKMVDLSRQLAITVKVKNDLIAEQVEKMKEVLSNFDTNNHQHYIRLEMLVEYMVSLRGKRDEVEGFVKFVNKTKTDSYLPVFPSSDIW